MISRSYFQHNVERLEPHMFGDSSQDVFSAVAFLRGKVNTGNSCSTEIAFVFGKARVAPLKALTIPKPELQAALLAARLRNEVQRALFLQIEELICGLTVLRSFSGYILLRNSRCSLQTVLQRYLN